MSGDPNLVRSMRLAMWMLANAIPTVEAGRHESADRRAWVTALDQLITELRDDNERTVIRGEVQS